MLCGAMANVCHSVDAELDVSLALHSCDSSDSELELDAPFPERTLCCSELPLVGHRKKKKVRSIKSCSTNSQSGSCDEDFDSEDASDSNANESSFEESFPRRSFCARDLPLIEASDTDSDTSDEESVQAFTRALRLPMLPWEG